MGGRKRERENPCFICGHFHNYEGGEPCSVCGHAAAPAAPEGLVHDPSAGAFPTAVLQGSLYLGSFDQASRAEVLKAMGITHLLNVVGPNCENLYRNTFTYHTVTPCANTKEVPLEECVAFLSACAAARHKVLVFCMTGSSRSASAVLAYLIHTHRWRLAHAHAWLKERRPTVNVQPVPAAQLAEWEQGCLGEEAATPVPPLPPNPMPRNDDPFGMQAQQQAGQQQHQQQCAQLPFQLPPLVQPGVQQQAAWQ